MKDSILTLKNIKVNFRTLDGIVEAVKGVNLDVKAGETVAIVGESGSGKSQLMMGTMGLLASNGTISGEANYRGTNLIGLPKQQLNTIRGRKIAMIFQEPMTSLDPLYTIGNQLIEPIMHHQKIGWDAGQCPRHRNAEPGQDSRNPNGAWAPTPMKCPAASASG